MPRAGLRRARVGRSGGPQRLPGPRRAQRAAPQSLRVREAAEEGCEDHGRAQGRREHHRRPGRDGGHVEARHRGRDGRVAAVQTRGGTKEHPRAQPLGDERHRRVPVQSVPDVCAAGEADQVEGDGQGREEARRDEGAEGRRRRRRLRPRARAQARRALGRRDRSRGERLAKDASQGARRAGFPPRLPPLQGPHLGEARAAQGRRGSRRRRRVHREQDPVVDHAGARGPRDPARVRGCVHGGAALRRRGGRRRRARARRTQAVLAPQGDEGPALSPHHPHVAQGVQLRRGPGRVGGEDEDGREGVGAPVPRARVRGEEERGEEERRGRGDAGDAAAGRHQDATGRAPGDQTTAQGCEEEGLTRRLVVAEVLSPAL
mmetsp:Transcript_9732/g.38002  ORF Transcript_9732/g.38002 Transcript_9732/m.38002 type:complete len:375 (-) Transcript_9732:40-1164(-)